MEYNTKYFMLRGERHCVYCNRVLKKYEDRMGFDYREEGEFFYFCTCKKAKEEIRQQGGILDDEDYIYGKIR